MCICVRVSVYVWCRRNLGTQTVGSHTLTLPFRCYGQKECLYAPAKGVKDVESLFAQALKSGKQIRNDA